MCSIRDDQRQALKQHNLSASKLLQEKIDETLIIVDEQKRQEAKRQAQAELQAIKEAERNAHLQPYFKKITTTKQEIDQLQQSINSTKRTIRLGKDRGLTKVGISGTQYEITELEQRIDLMKKQLEDTEAKLLNQQKELDTATEEFDNGKH